MMKSERPVAIRKHCVKICTRLPPSKDLGQPCSLFCLKKTRFASSGWSYLSGRRVKC